MFGSGAPCYYVIMKIQIVDEHDRPIGVRDRKEVDYKIDIYRVSALWLTNPNGQTLLAKRAAVKDKDPNKWGPAVAGTIDEGETYDTNVYKEAEEEIGLTGELFTKGPKILIKYPRTYFCQWYFVTLDRDVDSFIMQEDEVAELAWIDTERLKEDLRNNPDRYVPAMPQIVHELNI